MARISVNEAVARLGISKSTFYAHVRAGRVETFKDGARTFVHEAGLLALERGEPAAEAAAPDEKPALSPAQVRAATAEWMATVRSAQADARAAQEAERDALADAIAKRLSTR